VALIVERVLEIITAVQQRYPLAPAVIACNTASTVSLPALREKFAFPVVGVVPATKPAAAFDGEWCRWSAGDAWNGQNVPTRAS
jgi:glutamate racemase